MKIVIISDLHGNYDALSALPESGDELWVLGDLVNYGPQPAEVVDYVRKNARIAIRGNHDNAVGFDQDPRCTPRYHEMAEATRQLSLRALNEGQKAFLRERPLSIATQRAGAKFVLCHAVPSNPLYGYCPAGSEQWEKEVEQLGADFLLVGHTHTPFVQKTKRTTVVNPGSLGQPKTGSPEACYAVWEDGRIELKSFPYDVSAALRRIEQLPVTEPLRRDLAAVLQTGSVG